MAYDHGLVERIRDSLVRLRLSHVREKRMFGGCGYLERRSLIMIAWDEGLVVRIAPAEFGPVLQLPGVTPFAHPGDQARGRWVVADDAATADDLELDAWIERGLRGVAASTTRKTDRRKRPISPSTTNATSRKRQSSSNESRTQPTKSARTRTSVRRPSTKAKPRRTPRDR